MRLSALEVKKKEFQQKMRGIDQDEVQGFLFMISEEIEALTSERQAAEQRSADLEAQLAHYVNLEQTLERTLVAAQQTAVKLEEQAKKEAELILREAELMRDRTLNDVRLDLDRANSDLFRLRSEYESTLARMKSILEGFGRFIQSVDEEKRPERSSTNGEDVSGPEAARQFANLSS